MTNGARLPGEAEAMAGRKEADMDRLRRLSRGGRPLLALAVGGAIFGIATAVQADIPDSGLIHGCYKSTGGSLRVIDSSSGGKCSPSEAPLSWNQRGPTGATGPPGPAGTGTAKTITADNGLNNYVDLTTLVTGTDLATISLPAGSFAIFARAGFAPQAGNSSNFVAICSLTAGTDTDQLT